MNANYKIRKNWLKGMYWYTIMGAGGFGLGMLFISDTVKSLLQWPVNEPIIWGIVGSSYLSFGILSVFGLRAPFRFVPILFMQLIYKSTWLIVCILPKLIKGELPLYGIVLSIIMLTYVIGDLIAIPFSYIFSSEKQIT